MANMLQSHDKEARDRGISKSPTKSAVIPTSPTIIPPPSPVFKISLDLFITHLHNFNIYKVREYGEWTIQIKVFSTPDRLLVTSEPLLLTSLSADLDLHLPLTFDISTFGDIDNLIHNPLIVNFYETEYIVKDAKKKTAPEERVELMGQSFVDLLPFITGETFIQKTLPIFPPNLDADSSTTLLPENATVKLQIKTENGEPVIPKSYADAFNIIRFKIDGCYSMPAAWLPTSHTSGSHSAPVPAFTISTFLPTTAEHERYLIISNKVLHEHSADALNDGPTYWPVNPLFAAKAAHMMDAPKDAPSIGHSLHSKKRSEEQPSIAGNKEYPCIVIGTEFRSVLAKDAEEAFKSKAMASKVWPVEIFCVTVPEKHTGTTKKKNVEVQNMAVEEVLITRHGVAFIDLSPLLYPGTKKTEGKFPIVPYSVQLFTEKTGRKSVGQELFATPTAPSALPDLDKPTTLSTNKAKAIDTHPSNVSLRKSMAPSSATSHETPVSPATPSSADDVDQQLYTTSQSYMTASITLQRHLVPKKRSVKPEITLEGIKMPHPKTLFPADNGLLAMQQFRKEIGSTCRLIYSLCEKESREHSDWAMVEKNVEAALHKAGETCYLRTHLKDFIVRIVRDRFYRNKSFHQDDPEQYNDFLSELYCDLVREISHSLTFHEEQKTGHPMKNKESQSLHLRVLALEAEIEERLPKAEHFLLLRIHKSVDNGKGHEEISQYWVELGQFQLEHRKLREAVDSFAQSLKYDSQNVERLLLIGYALFEERKTDEALPFLEAAAVLSNSHIAYTALGLFYECLCVDSTGGMEVIKERALYQANVLLGLPADRLKPYEKKIKDMERLLKSEVPSNLSRGSGSLERSQKILEKLLHPFCPVKKTSSQSRDVTSNDILFPEWETLEYYDEKRKRKTFIKDGLLDNIFYVSLPAFASLGLYRFVTKCAAKLNGACDVTNPTLWKAAMSSWMARKNFVEVKELMKEVDKSEHAKNTRYLVMKGHFCYTQKNYGQARLCYDDALNQDINPTEKYDVYYRYGLMTKELKDWVKSKEMFHLAAKLHGTALNWLGCGVASFYLEDFVNAEVALSQSNYLDNTVPETWAYLAMVYYRSSQMSKAEKCLAAGLQCGLRESNEELMHEARVYIYSNKIKRW